MGSFPETYNDLLFKGKNVRGCEPPGFEMFVVTRYLKNRLPTHAAATKCLLKIFFKFFR